MNKRIKDLLIQEIRYENLKYESLSSLNRQLEKMIDGLIVKILKIDKGLNPSKLKKDIFEELEILYNEFSIKFKEELLEQKELINSESKVSIDDFLIGAFLVSELINNQKQNNFRRIIENINQKSVNFGDFILKNQNQIKSIINTASRAYRAKVRASEGKPIGWQSLAVLDGKTSAGCVALNEVFYSAKKYDYESIPDKPPRHINCRSILIPIYNKEELVRDFDLEDFLKENGQELLGVRKYEMFLSGKFAVKDFLDIKNGKWLTINQLKEGI